RQGLAHSRYQAHRCNRLREVKRQTPGHRSNPWSYVRKQARRHQNLSNTRLCRREVCCARSVGEACLCASQWSLNEARETTFYADKAAAEAERHPSSFTP